MDTDFPEERRAGEKEFRRTLFQRIADLEGRQDAFEDNFDELQKDIREIKTFLSGGIDGREDPVATRLHKVENLVEEFRLLLKGDYLGRGSLLSMAKAAEAIAQDAKQIARDAKDVAQGRVETRATSKGYIFALIGTCVLATSGIVTGVIANWDKIAAITRHETPEEMADRIRSDIEKLRKTRGPAVEKKLRELEREARRRYE